MKHAEHSKQMNALKRKMKMMGEMMMEMADMGEAKERVKKKVEEHMEEKDAD